jgi:hypothetical protein
MIGPGYFTCPNHLGAFSRNCQNIRLLEKDLMSKQTVLRVGLPLVTGRILQGFVNLLEAI